MLFDKQDGLMTEKYGQEVVLANPSVVQERKEPLMINDTSGLKCSGSSQPASLQLSLANRLQAMMACLGSTLYRLTWKERTTPAQRQICALRASAPRTFDNGCIGWPTPNAGPQNDTDTKWMQRREEVKKKYGPGHNGFGMTLGMAATLVGEQTPQVQD